MTNDKAPREFWVTPHIVGDATGGKQRWAFDSWTEVGSNNIHVIEHSAYLALEEKLRAAEAELEAAKIGLTTP